MPAGEEEQVNGAGRLMQDSQPKVEPSSTNLSSDGVNVKDEPDLKTTRDGMLDGQPMELTEPAGQGENHGATAAKSEAAGEAPAQPATADASGTAPVAAPAAPDAPMSSVPASQPPPATPEQPSTVADAQAAAACVDRAAPASNGVTAELQQRDGAAAAAPQNAPSGSQSTEGRGASEPQAAVLAEPPGSLSEPGAQQHVGEDVEMASPDQSSADAAVQAAAATDSQAPAGATVATDGPQHQPHAQGAAELSGAPLSAEMAPPLSQPAPQPASAAPPPQEAPPAGVPRVNGATKRAAGGDVAAEERPKRRRANPRTPPLRLLQEMREAAYTTTPYVVDKIVPDDVSGFLLVPTFVDADTPDNRGVHEQLLWRWGEPGASCRASAMKLCHDLMLRSDMDAVVERQLAFSLQRMTDAAEAPGGLLKQEHLVNIEVCVKHGDELLLDSLQWDLAQPYSCPEQYASITCQELGLRYDWFEAIVTHLRQRIRDLRQELANEGEDAVPRLPPITSVQRPAPADPHAAAAPTGPRIVPYSLELDLSVKEEQRLAALREKWKTVDVATSKVRDAEKARKAADDASRKAADEERSKADAEARKRAEDEAAARRKEDDAKRTAEVGETKTREDARLAAEAETRRSAEEQQRRQREEGQQAAARQQADPSSEAARAAQDAARGQQTGQRPEGLQTHSTPTARPAFGPSPTQAPPAQHAAAYQQGAAAGDPTSQAPPVTPHFPYAAQAGVRPGVAPQTAWSPADIAKFGQMFHQRTMMMQQGALAGAPAAAQQHTAPGQHPAPASAAVPAQMQQQQVHQAAQLLIAQQQAAQQGGRPPGAVQEGAAATAPQAQRPAAAAGGMSFPAMSPAAHAARVQAAAGAAANPSASAIANVMNTSQGAHFGRWAAQAQAQLAQTQLAQGQPPTPYSSAQLLAGFSAYQQTSGAAAPAAANRPPDASAQLLAQVQQETQAARQGGQQNGGSAAT